MENIHWLDIAGLDAAPDLNFETDFDDWRLVARRQQLRPTLASEAATQAKKLGSTAVGLPAGVSAMVFQVSEALENIACFAQAAHDAGLTLVVRIGDYGRAGCPRLSSQQALAAGADRVEVFEPDRRMSSGIHDDLRAKADAIDDQLRTRHLLDGQVVTVLDPRHDILAPENEWQEDSDWLTGLYCGAMSMAYRATSEEHYREHARSAFGALHELSTVAGVPGVVARHSRRQKPTDLGSGRKRWQAAPDGVRWWSGDTSRDQLSGHFFGIAAYHDLAADEAERETARADMDAIVGQIVARHLWAFDADGQPCTHANFFVSTLLALSMLKTACHLTGDTRYEERYREMIDPHFFLGHAMKECARQQDPFFQHYQQDTPFYHLLQYEREPELLRRYLRCLRLLHVNTRQHRNAYHLVEYAIHQPEADSGEMAAAELAAYNPDYLEVPHWREDTERLLTDPGADVDEDVRANLRSALTGDRSGLSPDRL